MSFDDDMPDSLIDDGEQLEDYKREKAEFEEEKHRRYIGKDKPVVEHQPPLEEAGQFDDADNSPDDPEQAGWDEHEETDVL